MKRASTWTATLAAAAAAATIMLGGANVPAEVPRDAPPVVQETPAQRGALTYRIHCAVCHGETARGDGPLAELLRVPPTDLTRIAEVNGGVFPADEVARIIDGRDDTAGHGPRDMPVWGLSFKDPGLDVDQERTVARRISDLVAFLESIQGESPAGD